MTYQEANILGSVCIGRIARLYAEFFDAQGNKLFSLQRSTVGDMPVVITNNVTDTKLIPAYLLPEAAEAIYTTLRDGKRGTIEWRKPYTKLFEILDGEPVYINANVFDWGII